jgi:hypothetical protein
MRAYCSSICGAGVLLGIALLFAGAGPSWAQEGQAGTKKELEDAWSKARGRNKALLDGSDQPKKGDEAVAKAVAQWFIFRITHKAAYDPAEVHKSFAAEVASAWDKKFGGQAKDNRKYINSYLGPALVASMKEVMTRNPATKDASTAINAAMMLPTMARLKADPIGAYLAELIDNKDGTTHDLVQLYALKSLREFLPIFAFYDDYETDGKINLNAVLAKKPHDIKNVDALTKFIERPVNVAGMTPGQIDAVRYVRREAIITLAQAGAPAVAAIKKAGKVEGAVAPTLLKVLVKGKGGLQPPASLHEKIEAALGLCMMKHANMPEYNPEIAAYLIGQTLVEFVGEYNKDLANIVTKKTLPGHAFKADANRFLVGLKEFAKNAGALDAAVKLNEAAPLILRKMTNYDPVNDGELRRQVQSLPKSRSPFKTLKTPPIQLDGQ